MSRYGYQAALAHLLVSEPLRKSLVAQPAVIAERFRLSETECAALAAIKTASLEFTAAGIGRARTRTLKRMFAPTIRAFPDDTASAIAEFVDNDIPRTDPDEIARWLAEGSRFVDCLRTISSAAAAFAELDLVRFDLLYDRDGVSDAALAVRTTQYARTFTDDELLEKMQPRVGRHVRLGQFSAEVLGPTATASAEPASPRSVVQLALRGHLDGGKIRTYRMEKQAFEVLRQCDGGRSLGGIWAEAAFSEPDDALKLVRFALTESLLCLDECPDGA